MMIARVYQGGACVEELVSPLPSPLSISPGRTNVEVSTQHCSTPYARVPVHKFGFALEWLKEFASLRWDAYANFIRNYPAPAKSTVGDSDGSNFAALRSNMVDPKESAYARAAVIAGWDLCAPAVRLLEDASKEARHIPLDDCTGYTLPRVGMSGMQRYHGDASSNIDHLPLGAVCALTRRPARSCARTWSAPSRRHREDVQASRRGRCRW